MEDYPKALSELEKRFSTETACLDYLRDLRWPDGIVCPKCGGVDMWVIGNGLHLCRSCRKKISILLGTIFQDSHLPLTTWFRAMWHVCVQKNGASALGLQRALGLGSYRTAWMCLHKLRRAMVRPSRDKLCGLIEVDEAYLGGKKHGKRGRGAEGKNLVLISAECDGKGIGRIGLSHIPDVSGITLCNTIGGMAKSGAMVITDGWTGYAGLEQVGYGHQTIRSDYSIGEDKLPRHHRVASLLKRLIMGTLQGSFGPEHLPDYLDEFTFRFNRRTSRSRGKLFYRLAQQAVQIEPVPYSKIIITQPVV